MDLLKRERELRFENEAVKSRPPSDYGGRLADGDFWFNLLATLLLTSYFSLNHILSPAGTGLPSDGLSSPGSTAALYYVSFLFSACVIAFVLQSAASCIHSYVVRGPLMRDFADFLLGNLLLLLISFAIPGILLVSLKVQGITITLVILAMYLRRFSRTTVRRLARWAVVSLVVVVVHVVGVPSFSPDEPGAKRDCTFELLGKSEVVLRCAERARARGADGTSAFRDWYISAYLQAVPEALLWLGEDDVERDLRKLLEAPSADRRAAACWSLAFGQVALGAEVLERLAGDPSPTVRQAATFAGSMQSGGDPLLPLMRGLNDPAESVWREGCECLWRFAKLLPRKGLGSSLPGQLLVRNHPFVPLSYWMAGEEAQSLRSFLRRLIGHPRPEVRGEAALVLAVLGDWSLVPHVPELGAIGSIALGILSSNKVEDIGQQWGLLSSRHRELAAARLSLPHLEGKIEEAANGKERRVFERLIDRPALARIDGHLGGQKLVDLLRRSCEKTDSDGFPGAFLRDLIWIQRLALPLKAERLRMELPKIKGWASLGLASYEAYRGEDVMARSASLSCLSHQDERLRTAASVMLASLGDESGRQQLKRWFERKWK